MILNLHAEGFRACSDRRTDTAHAEDTERLVLGIVAESEVTAPFPLIELESCHHYTEFTNLVELLCMYGECCGARPASKRLLRLQLHR